MKYLYAHQNINKKNQIKITFLVLNSSLESVAADRRIPEAALRDSYRRSRFARPSAGQILERRGTKAAKLLPNIVQKILSCATSYKWLERINAIACIGQMKEKYTIALQKKPKGFHLRLINKEAIEI